MLVKKKIAPYFQIKHTQTSLPMSDANHRRLSLERYIFRLKNASMRVVFFFRVTLYIFSVLDTIKLYFTFIFVVSGICTANFHTIISGAEGGKRKRADLA